MLKHFGGQQNTILFEPAAFGRLCVETSVPHPCSLKKFPAAFGRLCVETK
ncbi:hypothetical protein NEISICOT_03699 [Neisseria sicca ATCC 29256]|uniref:Uncharacterized protein n=1 Tax=Neisseria sicca ATCC 29256 TaxID=547045 RepID=C6MAW7_NEISI|nr:hypothetical protein NEISICOT_03699 [Neisseria sicca ATCC 29256]